MRLASTTMRLRCGFAALMLNAPKRYLAPGPAWPALAALMLNARKRCIASGCSARRLLPVMAQQLDQQRPYLAGAAEMHGPHA